MAKSTSVKRETNPFQLRNPDDAARDIAPEVHVYGPNIVCETDTRGYATPKNLTPTEIVLEASEGFIPLWEMGTTLRWRFQNQSMSLFEEPDAAKAAIKELIGKA